VVQSTQVLDLKANSNPDLQVEHILAVLHKMQFGSALQEIQDDPTLFGTKLPLQEEQKLLVEHVRQFVIVH